MLSQQELLGYEGAYLTEVVVQRVFEECQTYDGEMDFKSFLDFVLAIENRGTRSAMQVGSAIPTFRIGDDCHAAMPTAYQKYCQVLLPLYPTHLIILFHDLASF